MSDRPALLLLPGLLCDEYVFGNQIAALSDACDVKVPVFRGLSSITEMAQRVLDEAPPKFSVAGFSMGGRVAFQVYRLAPERIERFCVFDTAAGPKAEGEEVKRQAVIDLANDKGMEALAAAWLPPMLHPRNRNAAFMAPLTEMVLRFTPDDHEKQIRALVNRPDARPVLPTIACPTLVAVGAVDEWSPPQQHREMAAAIPGARLEIVEDSGHFLPVEQPDVFTRLLRDWMSLPAA